MVRIQGLRQRQEAATGGGIGTRSGGHRSMVACQKRWQGLRHERLAQPRDRGQIPMRGKPPMGRGAAYPRRPYRTIRAFFVGADRQTKGLAPGADPDERPTVLDLKGYCELRQDTAQARQGVVQGPVRPPLGIPGLVAQHDEKRFHDIPPMQRAIIVF